jgi:aspartate aminotransferase
LDFEAKDTVMCVGAGGGLNVVMKALLDTRDEILTPSPFFVEYGAYASNHGGVLKTVPTTETFQLDLNAFEKALNPKTKVIIINTPNNPTGVIYSQQSLDQLGELIQEKEKEFGHPIILVADDIYRRLVFDGMKSGDVLLSHPHSIRVYSHSKDLGLPGERIGFIAVHPGIPERETVRQALVLSNRILGFVNAPALMQRILPFMEGASVDVSIYQNLRDHFYSMLKELGFDVVFPRGAFYLFPKSPDPDDVAFVRRAQQELILVVPGSGFGGPGHFRISICCSEDAIKRSRSGFERLAKHYGLQS